MPKTKSGPPLPATISARRRFLDLTLKEVAARVKAEGAPCATTTVWNWENGLPVPERHWMPLAKALRTTVAALRAEHRW